MGTHRPARAALLLATWLALTTAGCRAQAPSDVRQAVMRTFDSSSNVRIHTAHQAELLEEDIAAGAEEVWCVTVTFKCWSCGHGEFRTCADNRLVRRIDGELSVSLVTTEDDRVSWEARGCELLDNTVGGY
jgi:hypothetical protein